ncbi:hypothetical protein EV175_006595, partial [Coemansia sp. RSA 1933]
NSEYLKKGIFIGVFDIRAIGLGSGLNNIEYYAAHSGASEGQLATNPFQNAFGFTLKDTWGVIDRYVDTQWPYRVHKAASELESFKRNLLVRSIEYFDGYRIGQVRHVFNPYTVLSFVRELQSVKSFTEIGFSKYFFRVQTGSMKVLESVKASSVSELRKYCKCLSSLFLRQREYRQHYGPLTELMTLDRIDDHVVEHIESKDQTRFPSDLDKETFKELADTCMAPFGNPLNDIHNMGREPLHAKTIVRLLYQAGYIVPTGKDSV